MRHAGKRLTQIQGCLSASCAVIRLDGFTVNMLFMRFFASGVTVSHSGEGYCETINSILISLAGQVIMNDMAEPLPTYIFHDLLSS